MPTLIIRRCYSTRGQAPRKKVARRQNGYPVNRRAVMSDATTIIEAHARATTAGQRGAVMLGDEMIDQASRKMAQAIVARDKAAGFAPGESGQVPE